jgi:hypothetical protein
VSISFHVVKYNLSLYSATRAHILLVEAAALFFFLSDALPYDLVEGAVLWIWIHRFLSFGLVPVGLEPGDDRWCEECWPGIE